MAIVVEIGEQRTRAVVKKSRARRIRYVLEGSIAAVAI
jgi:hypothetical protein